jgi:hypothetical protein
MHIFLPVLTVWLKQTAYAAQVINHAGLCFVHPENIATPSAVRAASSHILLERWTEKGPVSRSGMQGLRELWADVSARPLFILRPHGRHDKRGTGLWMGCGAADDRQPGVEKLRARGCSSFGTGIAGRNGRCRRFRPNTPPTPMIGS